MKMSREEKTEIINLELEEENKILLSKMKKLQEEYEVLRKDNIYLKNFLAISFPAHIKNEYEKTYSELEKIKYSRTYKFANKLNNIIRRK